MIITRSRAKISKTGAQIVGSIGDLLIQIFVHLPLKPLFRFKLVSKHWNSIISDPRFQLSMREHKNRAIGLIFQKIYLSIAGPPRVDSCVLSFDRSSNPLPPRKRVLPGQTQRIFHSCNGLLVLKSTAEKFYYVYNPTTKQKSRPLLKDDIKSREEDCVVGMYLAFDPSKSPHYKVVCVWLLNYHMDKKYQFEVYSSKTGSWEIRGGYNSSTGHVDFENGVYWNGAIHWVGSLGKSMFFNPDDHHDEMPHVMPDPPNPHGHDHYFFGPDPPNPHRHNYYFFGESCGHLHFAFSVGGCFFVYEMRGDYSEWFLKFRVDDAYSWYNMLRNINAVLPNIYSVVRGNKDEDSFLVLGTDQGEVIRYNLVDNTWRTNPVKGFYFDAYQTKSFHYIESPCSV